MIRGVTFKQNTFKNIFCISKQDLTCFSHLFFLCANVSFVLMVAYEKEEKAFVRKWPKKNTESLFVVSKIYIMKMYLKTLLQLDPEICCLYEGLQ